MGRAVLNPEVRAGGDKFHEATINDTQSEDSTLSTFNISAIASAILLRLMNSKKSDVSNLKSPTEDQSLSSEHIEAIISLMRQVISAEGWQDSEYDKENDSTAVEKSSARTRRAANRTRASGEPTCGSTLLKKNDMVMRSDSAHMLKACTGIDPEGQHNRVVETSGAILTVESPG